VGVSGGKYEGFGKGNGDNANGLMEPVNGIGNIMAPLENVVEVPGLLDYSNKESTMKFVDAGDVGNRELQEARGGSPLQLYVARTAT
jgi:hypothetical protein